MPKLCQRVCKPTYENKKIKSPVARGKDKMKDEKIEIRTDRKTKHETITKAICNKGFSGFPIVVARSNFRVGGQETAPQSLTAYSFNR
ncbi:MAG: hypothetical protein COT43_03700 [Candidatus Marinimicrobia bacterium CG08_land_8_20_14_0_20_45_22]|nr:MAG: hypothetical protein COT43_03700 [Candidatus Marinimicrobia bacterium CG08_land_8_20_14_0_20_45_22]